MLANPNGATGVLAVTCMTARTPARLLVGTTHGSILAVERPSGHAAAAPVTAQHSGHHGAVRGVHPHPSLPGYFLSVGDWTARVWGRGCSRPLLSTPYQHVELTGACWSPCHPAIFYTINAEGWLEGWDLQHLQQPLMRVHVVGEALTCLELSKVEGAAGLAAVGCSNGDVHVLELSTEVVEDGGEGQLEKVLAVSPGSYLLRCR